jgi:hypothetical protein
MTSLAASMVRLWVRFYTAGLESTVRERIRQEVEADLWEQMNSEDGSGRPMTEAMTLFLRWILGIPADVQRIFEEPSSGGLSMGTKKVLGVVARRKLWLTLLVVSGLSLSFLFFGIIVLILGIIMVAVQPRRVQQALNRL